MSINIRIIEAQSAEELQNKVNKKIEEVEGIMDNDNIYCDLHGPMVIHNHPGKQRSTFYQQIVIVNIDE